MEPSELIHGFKLPLLSITVICMLLPRFSYPAIQFPQIQDPVSALMAKKTEMHRDRHIDLSLRTMGRFSVLADEEDERGSMKMASLMLMSSLIDKINGRIREFGSLLVETYTLD